MKIPRAMLLGKELTQRQGSWDPGVLPGSRVPQCMKVFAWRWGLMKLTGFLFYFCHIQISTELRDEAMGPKFLKSWKREEDIKCLGSQIHYVGPHLTPFWSFQEQPPRPHPLQLHVVISWLLFHLMIHEFSVSFKTHCHWFSSLPLHLTLGCEET